MTDILINNHFRIFIIGLPLFIYVFKKNKLALDAPVFVFVVNILFSELFITLYPRAYNLVVFSILSITESIILGWLIYKETKKNGLVLLTVLPTTFAFIFAFFTDYSSSQLFGFLDKFRYVKPINANQFFDLCAIHNLSFIIVLFAWLYATLNGKIPHPQLNKKRFVYIFVFLAYFASSFFSIAFGRYLTTDLNAWYTMWGMVYLPLYLLFYTTLNITLFWNPAR